MATEHDGATKERTVFRAVVKRVRKAYQTGTPIKGWRILSAADVLGYFEGFLDKRVARFKKAKGGL